MPGERLRAQSMLSGLQWTIDAPKANDRKIIRITLFWHDAGGPVLTLYSLDRGSFNNEAFRDAIVVANQVAIAYVEGDSQPHVTLHELRDIGNQLENSITANPHTHVQISNANNATEQMLEQRLADTIWKLPALGLIGPEDAVRCHRYFHGSGWV